MGLFSRNKQAEPIAQTSFEGMEPILKTSFKLEYDEILQGLKIASANNPSQNKSKWGIALFTLFIVASLPFLFTKDFGVAIIVLSMACYLAYHLIIGEKANLKHIAKQTAENSKEAKLEIYQTGIKVIQENSDYNIGYRIIKMYESKDAFYAMVGKSLMLSFPKKCFGDDLPVVREIFIANMGMGRRYFQVNEKGKAI